MSVINRRNAVMGWLAWGVGKRVLKKKAKGAVPSVDPETKRPNKSAVIIVRRTAPGDWRDDARTGAQAVIKRLV